jgi:hypothetical protein
MTELSLNVLDIAQNSVKAEASLIEISVAADTCADSLIIEISDNGFGMNSEQLENVTDPFFTTRTTRKVGLGIPFFKDAAEITGGSFEISSAPGQGTYVKAKFGLSNIDRMPLGDMTETMLTLITFNDNIDFVYKFEIDGKSFILDTREFREILGGIPLSSSEVRGYIQSFLDENHSEILNGTVI